MFKGRGKGNQCHYVTIQKPQTIYETQYKEKCQQIYEDQCSTGKPFQSICVKSGQISSI